MLGGIWFSKAKPPMNYFLLPVMTEVNKLYKEGNYPNNMCMYVLVQPVIAIPSFTREVYYIYVGFIVETPDGQYTARAVLLQCSADLQARGPMTNMKNFNGKWGCLYCNNPGETTESDHLHCFWPYKSSAVLRSPQSFIDDGKAAFHGGNPVSIMLVFM